MPRNGSGVYSKPAGTTAVPNTTIQSSKFNQVVDDIAQDLNYPRPISAGGTGGETVDQVLTNLGFSTFIKGMINDANGGEVWATIGATQSLTSVGYTKLPNGLIIQWGRLFGLPDLAITLPVAFPNLTLLKLAVCELAFTNTATQVATVDQVANLNNIVVRFRNVVNGGTVTPPTNGTIGWLAIGF